MARPTLSAEEVELFRRDLCDVALRRFAEDGFASVTIRGLADELGCSHGRPYRYFTNKQDIFDTVRAHAYDRFAAALDLAAVNEPDPLERLRLMMAAYMRFAIDEPYAYRIMFELDQPTGENVPIDQLAKRLRAWDVWQGEIRNAIEAGRLEGSPSVAAHVFWAGVHGLVALHLAGKLALGENLSALSTPLIEAMLRAYGARTSEAP